MTKNDSSFDMFTNMMRMAGSAMEATMKSSCSMKDQFHAMIKSQLEILVAEMGLVKKDEFDAVKTMAIKALENNESLKKELAQLQSDLKSKSPTKTPKKTTTQKASKKS